MAFIGALFFGFVPTFLFAVFLYWLDRYEKEPKLLLGAAFMWGAVVAAGSAFVINTVLGIGVYIFTGSEVATDLTTGSIIAPVVEEILKGLAILFIFLIFRKDGFSVSGWSGFWFLVFVRVVLVGWQHPFYTAFTGIGFAVSRLSRNLAAKYLAPLAGLAMAIIAHSFHNTLASLTRGWGGLALGALIDWGGWLFMFLFAVWMIRREGRLLPKHLQQEVAEGRITAAQLRTAASPFGASLASLGALGRGKFRATTRFYQVLGELAHKMEEVSILGDEGGYAAIIERLRGEMANLSPQVSA